MRPDIAYHFDRYQKAAQKFEAIKTRMRRVRASVEAILAEIKQTELQLVPAREAVQAALGEPEEIEARRVCRDLETKVASLRAEAITMGATHRRVTRPPRAEDMPGYETAQNDLANHRMRLLKAVAQAEMEQAQDFNTLRSAFACIRDSGTIAAPDWPHFLALSVPFDPKTDITPTLQKYGVEL